MKLLKLSQTKSFPGIGHSWNLEYASTIGSSNAAGDAWPQRCDVFRCFGVVFRWYISVLDLGTGWDWGDFLFRFSSFWKLIGIYLCLQFSFALRSEDVGKAVFAVQCCSDVVCCSSLQSCEAA